MRKLFFRYFRNWPLKLKILVPLITFYLICVVGIIMFSCRVYYDQLLDRALIRCQELAHSVGTCAQITHYPYQLDRLISAFASEHHIRCIAILHKQPLTILTCNRRTLIGKRWNEYPLHRGIRLPKFPKEQ